MFEEFYEMYEPEEQEVVALINRCIGGGFNWKGNFWEMTVVTLGIVFCDTGKVSTKEERLDWPVTDEERNSDKGWGRFQSEQICRLKIRRMKEEWAKDLVVQPWCISQMVKAHEDCPELQAVLDEYSHIIDEDRCINAQRLEEAFYSSKTPDPVEDTEPKTADTAVTESDESDAAKILELLKNPETAALLKQLAKAL